MKNKLENVICFIFVTSLLTTGFISWENGELLGKSFCIINILIAFSFINIIHKNIN